MVEFLELPAEIIWRVFNKLSTYNAWMSMGGTCKAMWDVQKKKVKFICYEVTWLSPGEGRQVMRTVARYENLRAAYKKACENDLHNGSVCVKLDVVGSVVHLVREAWTCKRWNCSICCACKGSFYESAREFYGELKEALECLECGGIACKCDECATCLCVECYKCECKVPIVRDWRTMQAAGAEAKDYWKMLTLGGMLHEDSNVHENSSLSDLYAYMVFEESSDPFVRRLRRSE